MAAVPAPDNRMADLLVRAGDLPVLPHVVFRLMEAAGTDGHSLADIERAVFIDPGFAVRVLRRASLGNTGDVISLREAIRFVGTGTVIDLATSAGSSFEAFAGKTDPASLRKRRWWRASIDTAICCGWIAEQAGSVSADEAYTCGLLHSIGKTMLDRCWPDRYLDVDEHVHAGMDEFEAERRAFGFAHPEVGAAAVAKWGLPSALSCALEYDQPDVDAPLRAVVALSAAIARLAIAGASGAPDLPEWALNELGFSPLQAAEILDGGQAAITAAELAQF